MDTPAEGVENPASGEEASQDPVKQLKSEFSRKLENINAILEAQNKQSQDLLNILVAQQSRSSEASKESKEDDGISEDLVLSDPKEYARRVTEKAVREAKSAMDKDRQASNRVQQQEASALAALRADYPELNDSNSELARKAIEIYNKIGSSGELAVKASVREAAADLGLVPVKKRQSNNADDFSMSGGSSMSEGNSRSGDRGRSKKKVSEATLEFARLLGRDVDDPKVKARLEKAAERRNWKRYSKE